jgi:hypothetical protein
MLMELDAMEAGVAAAAAAPLNAAEVAAVLPADAAPGPVTGAAGGVQGFPCSDGREHRGRGASGSVSDGDGGGGSESSGESGSGSSGSSSGSSGGSSSDSEGEPEEGHGGLGLGGALGHAR